MRSSNILITISLLIFIYGCEYERIAAPESNCDTVSIELKIESVENTSCEQASGEIVANVNDDAQYVYRLNDGDFSENNVFPNLSAGNYTIQAKAVNTNCISEAIEVIIENEDGLQLSLIEKNNSECSENTGSIMVEQLGGVEPIEYIINNDIVQNNPEFTGLSNGNYTILARDANGCEAEISGVEIKTNISLINDIKPIIATNCAISGCHNGSRSPDLSIDENIIENASRIKSRTGSETMPPAGRPDLTNVEIQAIACWVDDGALDN
ncbi:hypothetical protein [Marivirga sp.]|uniref:hypothetical protein n=1 Tax=Marivirga sp. TaxID=2018662 RepID=UPI0025FDF942|nr:hypothetical protein [Marivirga sp.]